MLRPIEANPAAYAHSLLKPAALRAATSPPPDRTVETASLAASLAVLLRSSALSDRLMVGSSRRSVAVATWGHRTTRDDLLGGQVRGGTGQASGRSTTDLTRRVDGARPGVRPTSETGTATPAELQPSG